jgi:hypothetical protein
MMVVVEKEAMMWEEEEEEEDWKEPNANMKRVHFSQETKETITQLNQQNVAKSNCKY